VIHKLQNAAYIQLLPEEWERLNKRWKETLNKEYINLLVYSFNSTFNDLHLFIKEMEKNKRGFLRQNDLSMGVPYFNKQSEGQVPEEYFKTFFKKILNANIH